MKTFAKLLGSIALSLGLAAPAMAQGAKPVTKILITNVNVFDGTSDAITPKIDVLIEGNLIKAVGKNLDSQGATVIDGGGRTLMPGMIEAHGHIMLHTQPVKLMITQDAFEQGARGTRRAHDYLMAGFTTERDLGGNCFGVKKVVDADVFAGPRIYCGGASIGQTSGHGDFRMPTDGHPKLEGWVRPPNTSAKLMCCKKID
jgi:imidazolonepropionase-like amidohydrolase